MATRKFSLGAGVKDVLAHGRVSAELAIAELVWNSLDADATAVAIELRRATAGGPITEVVVTDDGHGLGPHEIERAFATHRSSPKSERRLSPAGRPMHGRNGRGRFCAFALADEIRWRTWGEDELGEVVGSEIRLSRDAATQGVIEDLDVSERDLVSPTGTRVVMTLIDSQKAARVGDESFLRGLEAVLAPVLLSLGEISVAVDGHVLDPRGQIEDQAQPEVTADLGELAKLDGSPAGEPVLEVIEWAATTVRPCIYLCDEDGSPLFEYTGALPKVPGIDWTAFLRWEGFARDTVNEGDLQSAKSTFAAVMEPAVISLAKHLSRRSYVLTGGDIQRWVDDGTYPYLTAPQNALEEAEQEGFRELVAVSRKAVPSDIEQRRMALGLMHNSFRESPDDALHVIAKVKGLDENDVRAFRDLLNGTPLSRVVRAATGIKHRVDFLVALDELLHSEESRGNLLEKDHLHRLVENNAWVFGNEWALVRSEAGLTSVLREHLRLLRPEEKTKVAPSDVEGGRRRVDLLFAGSIAEHRRRRRLVVELKRSSVGLGLAERNQIEAYATAIAHSPRFQGEVVQWEFWLIGTTIEDSISGSVNQKNSPPGQFANNDMPNGSSYRIWVKSWSEVLAAASEDIRFFQDEIEYDPDVAEALSEIRRRFPDAVPPSRIDTESGGE